MYSWIEGIDIIVRNAALLMVYSCHIYMYKQRRFACKDSAATSTKYFDVTAVFSFMVDMVC